MIYFVSKLKFLYGDPEYDLVSTDKALQILDPLKEVQLDTETSGLDCHSKELLTVQLGFTDNQVVFDWTTLSIDDRNKLKEYLESDRLFIGHNLMFDLQFLYKQHIYPKRLYDTMIAEQLIYLGYPRSLSENDYYDIPGYERIGYNYELSYSLKATAYRRLSINIDKTVRGKIINEGLTTETIIYAAGDVKWLELIKEKQLEELNSQELLKAQEFESEFIKSLAYTKYCGIHLDADKWKAKMTSDKAKYDKAISNLNAYVVELDNIGYIHREPKSPKDEQKLISLGFDNRTWNYNIKGKFTTINRQGSLWGGFDLTPKCTINWSSQKQVIPLFELLGISVETFDKKTKANKKSIEEKILACQKDDFPIIPLFLEYQEAAKVISTYGQNWLDAINPNSMRIHAELHSIGTDTGE